MLENTPNLNPFSETMSIEEPMRKTEQEIMPARVSDIKKPEGYDIYPFHSIGEGKIHTGISGLCDYIIEQGTVRIDGYIGVHWISIQDSIDKEFASRGVKFYMENTQTLMKPEDEIGKLTEAYVGTFGSVWGKQTDLSLIDYFNLDALKNAGRDGQEQVNILIGPGAALAEWPGGIIYFDLPKNELQHRMSAGSITNLGMSIPLEQTEMYKRFYFVDWVILNKHKKSLLNQIDIFSDGQYEQDLNWAHGNDIRKALNKISKSVFRPRPWFAPGAWGGQWMKNQMPQLEQREINYAWSFEIIAPENGIVFESGGFLLEVSFDVLMFAFGENILGLHSERFGDEFPIRFDFLDTFDGGNLSIQCHPSLPYIQSQFGERITQDETYYILDCKANAKVYLGFQENINPGNFKTELEQSSANGIEVDIERYVQVHSAKKHDLFLIPNQTIHSAGAENLVLEISATPYIFTFKMYDWLRMDLNGKPRPINIDHAFKNLDFSRKGEKVKQELISKPYLLSDKDGVRCFHLPTHAEHFYDVHRLEFDSIAKIENENRCHVLMLVEGDSITVRTADGSEMTLAYAETFIIPAAAENYTITNNTNSPLKVIKAFLK
ncbi:class I mannose-6-phosphate isomerase [Pedobacter aquatilis]|uniref:class I mannose-6-phosphate isomerase n=1 Tax=Pedobacter aquatilis TaxID=351343 RepID=UPI0025B4D324|nr:class I mannose-6-phosphate isomerase [Pedobacter aquatilis]MDN3588497.1 class I mannose-6-phosphate isomerase [Pedobacter aquatilis]